MKAYQAKVLVVDDEPSLPDSITFTLEHEGYQAFSAATGEQGLKQFQESQPDLVILESQEGKGTTAWLLLPASLILPGK